MSRLNDGFSLLLLDYEDGTMRCRTNVGDKIVSSDVAARLRMATNSLRKRYVRLRDRWELLKWYRGE